ncbi:MAG: hypothetical protein ABFE01_25990 [Phycisphaerales bacterium]
MSGGVMVMVAIVGLLMAASGCSTMTALHGADVPGGAQVVGGGFMINWEAPTAGTVYLVEKTSGKIIETRSLDEDDTYEFEMSLDDEAVVKTFENAFGVPMGKAKFVLYFKPASPKSDAP